MAQFGSAADAAALAFDPIEIANDFQERVDTPTPANAFVQQFFTDFQVPQAPASGQTLLQTWIDWATNHPGAVEEYLIRRKVNHDAFFQ